MTTIYIMFREYSDQSRQPSKSYINGVDFPLDDGVCIQDEFNNTFSIIEYFDYEFANRLYDEANLKGLLHQSLELPEEYPGFATSIRSQLRLHGFTDWEDMPAEGQEGINYHNINVTKHILGDFAHRQQTQEHTIIINVDAIDCPETCIVVDTPSGSMKLPVAKDIRRLHDWLSKNRDPQRRYDFNAKHGDASRSSETYTDRHGLYRAAQLETTEYETTALLKLAVGQDRHSELWYWDEDRGKYIYFENQNTVNPPSFHAYHLVEGDKNFENIDIEKLRKVQNIDTTK